MEPSGHSSRHCRGMTSGRFRLRSVSRRSRPGLCWPVSSASLSRRRVATSRRQSRPRPLPGPGELGVCARRRRTGDPATRPARRLRLVLDRRTLGVFHRVLPCGARIFLDYGGRRVSRASSGSPVGENREFDLTRGARARARRRWRPRRPVGVCPVESVSCSTLFVVASTIRTIRKCGGASGIQALPRSARHPPGVSRFAWRGSHGRVGKHLSLAVNDANTQAALEETIERYNEAWNAHDLDAIVASTRRAWCSRITPQASESRATRCASTVARSSPTGQISRFAHGAPVCARRPRRLRVDRDRDEAGDGRAPRVGRDRRVSVRGRPDCSQGLYSAGEHRGIRVLS